MEKPPTPNDRRAEVLASIRASDERIAKHREEVLRAVAELRRISELQRRRRRFRLFG